MLEKIINKYFILMYLVGFALLFIAYSLIKHQQNIITELSLLNFDADHYFTISISGYYQKLVAFFPFFPYVWKYSGLSIFGICFLNILCYSLGLYLLQKTYQFSNKTLLFFLTIPSTIFMFLPYSEAMFFLFSCLVLFGLKKENYWVFYTSLFVIGFIRPTASVFVIALILVFAYRYLVLEKKSSQFIIHTFLSVFISILSFYIVLNMEDKQTGEWLGFFSYQKTEWGNYLQIPQLHIATWGSRLILLLDGTALLLGLVLIIYLFIFVKNIFLFKKTNAESTEVFSYLYLIGMALVVLLFRGGLLFSLNRFFFCSAFFCVAAYYFYQKLNTISFKNIWVILGGLTVFWLLFGSYTHIQVFISFLLLSIYLLLYLLLKNTNDKIVKFSYITILICNVILQVFLLEKFLLGEWVA